MSSNCKHVAAVLLQLARTRKSVVPKKLERSTVNIVEEPEQSQLGKQPSPAFRNWIRESVELLSNQDEAAAENKHRVVYLLSQPTRGGICRMTVGGVRVTGAGSKGQFTTAKLHLFNASTRPKYWTPEDWKVASELHRASGYAHAGDMEFALKGRLSEIAFLDVLATGKCYLQTPQGKAATLKGERSATPIWTTDSDGTQRFVLEVEGGGKSFIIDNLWYADEATGEVGRLREEWQTPLVKQMLSAPAIPPEEAAGTRSLFLESFPEASNFAPLELRPPRYAVVDPVPVLKVYQGKARRMKAYGSYYNTSPFDLTLVTASLGFSYEGIRVEKNDRTDVLRRKIEDQIVVYRRNFEFEEQAAEELAGVPWTLRPFGYELEKPGTYCIESFSYPYGLNDQLLDFLYGKGRALQSKGWILEIAPELAGEVLPEGDVEFAFHDDPNNKWFELQLGLLVGAERIDLAPVLAGLIKKMREAKIAELDEKSTYLYKLEDGRVVPIPVAKLKEPLRLLLEIYGDPSEWKELKKLPKWRALDVLALEGAVKTVGDEQLRALAESLRSAHGILPVHASEGFQGHLRAYQEQGLSWLQFLAAQGLGGILADDMGLGKTVQMLAHLIQEKESGRMTVPVLLVAPTSVIPNWAAESAKFAPSLKVLTLHGADRKDRFGEIATTDLVLTTYPLLARDAKHLLAHKYHALVLDEAQFIKNAKTNAAGVVRLIDAHHRICLTGTPIENHLGELWSVMESVLPGHLGTEASFRKRFRIPIEKLDDDAAKTELARRIKPFVLRRTKEEVDLQLPPKTEIVKLVEMESVQRGVYEAMRSAMDSRVRGALKQMGLSKSHIIVLDALLKLRQICCDPRLIKRENKSAVAESAKLEALKAMVETLVSEGRRILIFSQFTSMIDLIEPELAKLEIEFVKIVGDTIDRATPVKRFQDGEVPVFLISLKAGGTGLNLTAADTVIHYDPWWNPAVERQATDRAHRIGQTKPVFVYKLVAQDTVEEKILELQRRKGELAAALLDGGGAKLDLSPEDVALLFE
jgi:superfamily II DNA or RNA helicase